MPTFLAELWPEGPRHGRGRSPGRGAAPLSGSRAGRAGLYEAGANVGSFGSGDAATQFAGSATGSAEDGSDDERQLQSAR